jgi:sugar lactone lactonase YvrE
MKTLFILFLAFMAGHASAQDTVFSATKIWETPDMLTTSESVCYDSANQAIYVSCIDGNPTEKDGNGFISKLSMNGEVEMFRWAGSLNAPKGMGIHDGALYVTDIDRVVKLNLEDGKILQVLEVEEAKFLNDITVGPDGSVYASDMHTTNIYRVKDGQISLWLSSAEFENPNGLNYLGEDLLVGTKNGIFAVSMADKSIRHLVTDTGGIDGLEIYGDGYFVISDWSGKVQMVHPSRPATVLFNTTDQGVNAADIAYIANLNLLLVPTFSDNRVTAYEIIAE